MARHGKAWLGMAWFKTKKEMKNKMVRYTEVVAYRDMETFFNQCPNEYWKRTAKGLYYTGCRAGELIQIKAQDIKFELDFIQVKIHTEKNPHAPIRYVPINNLREALGIDVFDTKLLPEENLFPAYNQRITRNSYLRVMRKMFNKYWGVAPHYFRHCRLTHCVTQFDFNDQELVKYAGWSDSKPAKWYVSLKTTDLQRKMV